MRGKFLLLNNEFVSFDQWDESSIKGIVVYEVLRIIEGVPLFFDDHYQRLVNSCRIIGQTYIPDKKVLLHQIMELAKINDFKTGNITIKLNFNHSVSQSFSHSVSQSFSPSVYIYFIPHSYPSDEDYQQGVNVGFLETERINPEAKVEQGMKEKAGQMLQSGHLFEVMLVDREGYITEGSKSNLVFVKEDSLYTCPLNRVLKGITLAKVLEIASKENIPVKFEAVHRSEISSYDALFITGTSPKILSVATAGSVSFQVDNPLIRHLMFSYNQLINEEIGEIIHQLRN